MTQAHPLHIVILAAGMGTRMRSSRPKVLHRLAGKSLLEWVIHALDPLQPTQIHIIYGHGGTQLQNTIQSSAQSSALNWVHQAEQQGTAHALMQALPHIPDDARVLVLAGDVPLIQTETLREFLNTPVHSFGLLLARIPQPFGYGRIIRDAQHNVIDIVEEKDASEEQRAIQEINTGIYLAQAKLFKQLIPFITTHNAQKEYYLTQMISLAAQQGVKIHTSSTQHSYEIQGVNTQAQLAELERTYQKLQALRLLEQGVGLADPNRLDIRGQVHAEQDVYIDVNCVFEGEVTLEQGARIGPHCVLKNVTVGAHAQILAFSLVEEALIGPHAQVGPFARVRPGTVLGEHAKIGNFVEAKNTRIGQGSKVNHLSYVGDALIGDGVNVGAGTITCNYDGANKFQTVIEDQAFIGSGCQLVAPVTIGKGATIGAGSTIRTDAPAHALTLSKREQKSIASWQRPPKKS